MSGAKRRGRGKTEDIGTGKGRLAGGWKEEKDAEKGEKAYRLSGKNATPPDHLMSITNNLENNSLTTERIGSRNTKILQQC